jgi:predicted alpha/beta-hydrolase family hydrolase
LKVVELLKREPPACENRRLVIGGKSLGGRIASLVADEAGVAGLVCLGCRRSYVQTVLGEINHVP